MHDEASDRVVFLIIKRTTEELVKVLNSCQRAYRETGFAVVLAVRTDKFRFFLIVLDRKSTRLNSSH